MRKGRGMGQDAVEGTPFFQLPPTSSTSLNVAPLTASFSARSTSPSQRALHPALVQSARFGSSIRDRPSCAVLALSSSSPLSSPLSVLSLSLSLSQALSSALGPSILARSSSSILALFVLNPLFLNPLFLPR